MSMPFHSIKSKMWADKNGTFCQIREQYGQGAAFLAVYLMTSPHAMQTGLYHCPVAYMAHETGISASDIKKYLSNLQEIGFCKYDDQANVVWVIKFPLYQVTNFPRGRDNKVRGALKTLSALPTTDLLEEFLNRWNIDLDVHGIRLESRAEQIITDRNIT